MSEPVLAGAPRGRRHVVVREYLRALATDAAPGTPTPSERSLALRFDVARMTVRHAIDALVAEGILERLPGRGTYVTKPMIDMRVRLSSFSEEMRRRGKAPSSTTVLLRAETAGPGVARALEVAEGAPIVHWQRARDADGEPMAVQHAYLSRDRFPELLRPPSPDSLYAMFAARGVPPTWGEDSARAGTATTEEAGLLGVGTGEAVLRVSRRTFHADAVIEVSRTAYRGDRYTLWMPVLRPAESAEEPPGAEPGLGF